MKNEILRQKNPQLAEFYEQWSAKYAGTHVLDSTAARATLYEGVLEMARYIAALSQSATLTLSVSNEGVDGLTITAVPHPVKPATEV